MSAVLGECRLGPEAASVGRGVGMAAAVPPVSCLQCTWWGRSPLVLAVGREVSFLVSVGAQGGSFQSSRHRRPQRTFWLGPGSLVATHEAGPMGLGTV